MSEQTKWEREAGIFASFLEAEPGFAGARIAHWEHNRNDSPDILCTDATGSRIGVEMTEWLDQEQTRDYSRWEQLLGAVRFPADWTVTMRLSPFGRRCKSKEEPLIAAELSRVIADEISRPKAWPSGLLSFIVVKSDFADRAPTAAKYCEQLEGNSRGSGRLHLSPGGSFSPNDAEAALRIVIAKKLRKKSYAAIRRELALGALYLLIYYDIAIIKNTPNMDVDVPAVVASAVAGIPSAFDAAFVLMFPAGDANSGRAAYRIDTSAR
jgi:hypothetical protein